MHQYASCELMPQTGMPGTFAYGFCCCEHERTQTIGRRTCQQRVVAACLLRLWPPCRWALMHAKQAVCFGCIGQWSLAWIMAVSLRIVYAAAHRLSTASCHSICQCPIQQSSQTRERVPQQMVLP